MDFSQWSHRFAALVRRRRYALFPFAIVSLAFSLYRFPVVIGFHNFDWSAAGLSLYRARIPPLLLAIAGIYGCYAIRSLRWMVFSRSHGVMKFSNVYRSTLAGFTCSLLLGRMGEPVRPILIARNDSLPMPAMFGVYVVERLFDIAATVVLVCIAIFLFGRDKQAASHGGSLISLARSAGIFLSAGLIVGSGLLVYFCYKGAAWLNSYLTCSAWGRKVAPVLAGFSEGLRFIHSWVDCAVIIGYSIVHWLLLILVYLWVAHAFGGRLARLTFAGATLVCAFTLIGSAVQIPGIGGGAQVASFLVLTGIFGVEREIAATASIVIWMVAFAACGLTGLPLLFHEGWSVGECKARAHTDDREVLYLTTLQGSVATQPALAESDETSGE